MIDLSYVSDADSLQQDQCLGEVVASKLVPWHNGRRMASLPLLSAPGSGPGGGGRPRAGTADEDASRHSLHLHHVTNPFVDRAIAMERVHQTMEEPQKVCRGDEVSFLSLFMWVYFLARECNRS